MKTSQSYKDIFAVQNSVRKNKFLIELQAIKERTGLIDTQLKEYEKLFGYYKQELIRGQLSVINYVNTIKNSMALQKEYILLQTRQQLLINAYNYWNW
ncbi:MAG: hypothetical protein NVS3B8_06050 [Chitinophagaceae bacterium]